MQTVFPFPRGPSVQVNVQVSLYFNALFPPFTCFVFRLHSIVDHGHSWSSYFFSRFTQFLQTITEMSCLFSPHFQLIPSNDPSTNSWFNLSSFQFISAGHWSFRLFLLQHMAHVNIPKQVDKKRGKRYTTHIHTKTRSRLTNNVLVDSLFSSLSSCSSSNTIFHPYLLSCPSFSHFCPIYISIITLFFFSVRTCILTLWFIFFF